MKVAVVLQQMQSYREREIKGLSPFWLLLHFLCCLVSTVLGFRFSRLLFFLFFSSSPLLLFPSSSSVTTTTTTTTTVTTVTTTSTSFSASASASLPPPLPPTNANANTTAASSPPPPPPDAFSQPVTTRPVVGRHGIRVRPWPHPHPDEVMRAHHILRQVQLEQRRLFSPASAAGPRPLLVVTPTFVRPTQALHLTALAHTLRLVPYPLTWLVVEAGGITNATASLLARSRVPFLHLGSEEAMPDSWEWEKRRVVEAQMRIHALRLIARQQMDGVVIFADESNVHNLRLFDEAQKLQSLGSIRLSFLTDPRTLNQPTDLQAPLPVQAPICDSHGHLSAWRMLDPANQAFAPHKMEWAGFLFDSKWLFSQNLDSIDHTLKALLGDDGSAIQPLGDCGEKVLVWWIRADTLPDAIFPPGWAIENGIPLKSETNSTANRR